MPPSDAPTDHFGPTMRGGGDHASARPHQRRSSRVPRRVGLRRDAGHRNQYAEIHSFSLLVLRHSGTLQIRRDRKLGCNLRASYTVVTHFSFRNGIDRALNWSTPEGVCLTMRHRQHELRMALAATEYSDVFSRIFTPRCEQELAASVDISPASPKSGTANGTDSQARSPSPHAYFKSMQFA